MVKFTSEQGQFGKEMHRTEQQWKLQQWQQQERKLQVYKCKDGIDAYVMIYNSIISYTFQDNHDTGAIHKSVSIHEAKRVMWRHRHFRCHRREVGGGAHMPCRQWKVIFVKCGVPEARHQQPCLVLIDKDKQKDFFVGKIQGSSEVCYEPIMPCVSSMLLFFLFVKLINFVLSFIYLNHILITIFCIGVSVDFLLE